MESYGTLDKKLSVVVPVYNEFKTIATVIQKLLEVTHVLEIVVINDGSTDGTREILDKLSLEYSQQSNSLAIATATSSTRSMDSFITFNSRFTDVVYCWRSPYIVIALIEQFMPL